MNPIIRDIAPDARQKTVIIPMEQWQSPFRRVEDMPIRQGGKQMVIQLLIDSAIKSWKTAAVGLGTAGALLLARHGVNVSEIELSTLIEAAGIALIGLLAKDSDKSHSTNRNRQ